MTVPSVLVSLTLCSMGTLKLASPGLTAVNLSEAEVAFYSDELAQRMMGGGVEVITASQISALLGFERQKELLGCSEESSSCVAEIANALGVDGLIIGNVARLDRTLYLQVKIVSARDEKVLATHSASASSRDALFGRIPEVARALRRGLATHRPLKAEVAPGSGWRPHAWLPAAGGVGLGVAGGLLYSWGASRHQELTRQDPQLSFNSLEEAQRYARSSVTAQRAGVGLLALGGAALLTAGAMLLFGEASSGAVVAAAPLIGGNEVGVLFTLELR
jgi:hypothetical protein